MQVPKLAQVWPIVKVETREGMYRIAQGWEAEARHQEARADIFELLYKAYKLQLAAAEKEIQRIRRWSE